MHLSGGFWAGKWAADGKVRKGYLWEALRKVGRVDVLMTIKK